MPSLQRDSHVCYFRKNFIHSYVKFFMLCLQHVGSTESIFGILLIIYDEGTIKLYRGIIDIKEPEQLI